MPRQRDATAPERRHDTDEGRPRRHSTRQRPLGEILVAAGLIDEKQLAEALARQRQTGKLLGQTLVELGYVSDDEVADALAEQLGLRRVRLGTQAVDARALSLLDPDFVRHHRVATIAADAGKVLAVTPDPLDVRATDELRQRLQDYDIELAVVSEREFRQIEGTLGSVDGLVGASRPEETDAEVVQPQDSRPSGRDKPIVRVVERLLTRAVTERASDIHVEPHGGSTLVRMRVDGLLRDVVRLPKSSHRMLVARIKVLSGLDLSVSYLPQDGHFRWQHNGSSIDVRVSTLPVVGGEKVVMRLLGSEEEELSLDDIGFEPALVRRFKGLLDRAQGMILVTGPTASGKTTTLYAALQYILRRRPNITTIEDPVERDILGINQVQVNEKRGLTFLTALRSILRQDPDVIMIGETRDAETARTAFQAALTGHLVLTTLHTNDAASSITRLVDLGLPPYLIAATLLGSLAQRLVRKVCEHCGRWTDIDPVHIQHFPQVGIPRDLRRERRGVGCPHCRHTGFSGRLAIGELVVVTSEIEQLIAAGAHESEIRSTASARGMKTMAEVAAELIRRGVTTAAEVLRVLPSVSAPSRSVRQPCDSAGEPQRAA